MEETPAVCGCDNTARGEEPTFPTNNQGPKVTSSAPRSVVKGTAAKIKAKAVASRKASKADEKDTRRHQKALDWQIAKGQREAEWRSQVISPPPGEPAISRQIYSQPLEIEARQVNKLCSQAC